MKRSSAVLISLINRFHLIQCKAVRIGDNTAAEWYVHDIYDENLA